MLQIKPEVFFLSSSQPKSEALKIPFSQFRESFEKKHSPNFARTSPDLSSFTGFLFLVNFGPSVDN
jgi:hypothetical protein